MKNPTKSERLFALLTRLTSIGFTTREANTLRRAQLTLHGWDEAECGWDNGYASFAIERDEVTGKPFRLTYPHTGKTYRTAIPDREKGALKRIAKVVADRNTREWIGSGIAIDSLPGTLRWYHQGDCRGCALYLVKVGDIPAGAPLESCYNRGLAVCV